MRARAIALAVGVASVLSALAPAQAQAPDYPYPERVRVLPVFLVPTDQAPPSRATVRALGRHLRWAQARYRKLLAGRDTFELAKTTPDVVRGRFRLGVYRSLEDDAAQFVSELLAHYGVNRFTNPYVFVVVLVNPCENAPAGGGRPCNGGFNRGGGVVVLSSYALRYPTPVQSTLRHELGHSFGLPHVDVYGSNMRTSRSIMSYNRAHHTRGFEPSETPGGLLPEDLRGLALNDRVFANLELRLPEGTRLRRRVELGPMVIPDEARFVADRRARTGPGVGFELSRAGMRLRQEPSWNRAQALSGLNRLRLSAARSDLVGRHEGAPLFLARGFELFYGRERVGADANWSLEQGVKTLRWNLETKPGLPITARYDGQLVLWAPRLGYELFHDGARVGHAPTWSRAQGLANLRWNLKAHPHTVVTARFNGVPLSGQ